jgi:transposase
MGSRKETPTMRLSLTDSQRRALESAAAAEKGVRGWKRYRAVLLRAEGRTVRAVAHTLACSEASVYGWTAAWRREGVAGLHEGDHGGGQVKLDGVAEGVLAAVLATDPQAYGHRATGWTVPLLGAELAAAGYVVSAKTVRRALHRLGYRWKRPQSVLGRPDPASGEKRGP